MTVREWCKRQLFSACWDIGDTFMGWAFKFLDRSTFEEAVVLPARRNTILLNWDPQRGLVEQSSYTTGTSGWLSIRQS